MTSESIIPVATPPIILLGMHRSGTSLIARLLDELGLFQGHELQEDHESTYFLEVNDRLMKRIGASWDNPSPAKGFLEDARALDLTVRCISTDLQSGHFKGYLGGKRYFKQRSLARIEGSWGWKDPRTVFTLPVWLSIFPNAKLLYIVRNGIDVAASLRVREVRELARRIDEYDGKQGQLNKHSMLERAGFKGSARCLSLAGGFGLWEEYVAEAERQLAAVPNERLIVRYEQFLAEPADALTKLAVFCGVNPASDRIAAAVAAVNASRGAAFKSDSDLLSFYDQVRATRWMEHYQYDQL
ncbi:sulfotransferase [Humisphaera borealis]|uniref:Sulfotransferase n=1 Tax=Humisphaera borealis TaxID=2807512 RepID=A0A7M2WQI0_9BACT|nr:sulfotransferase [Humisphaera borealis]QOV87663.1 sulfotransferase [Humisphaera borealis]